MADSIPFISFIICTYNRAEYLDDTLKSLQRYAVSEYPYEILVIDNNSTDGTPQVAKYHQSENNYDHIDIRYIFEGKQGLSHARNRGIKEARADNLIFFDDDIKATETLIPAWRDFFEQETEALAAGGRIHVQFDDPRPEWMSRFLLPLLGHHDLGNVRKEYPANKYPFGGNMGFKKSMFDHVGLFDTELGRKGTELNAGEEKELFQRIRDSSETILYLPEAFLYHRVNRKRLTVDYIRKQALGVGHSLSVRLGNTSRTQKNIALVKEFAKALITLPLSLIYALAFQPAKASLLIRFRVWIWEGYFKASDLNKA